MGYLESNNLLSSEQFGFRKAYSTSDQLLVTYNLITHSKDQGKVVDLVFFDYSKAFDVVCHDILLCKLLQIGVNGLIFEWIRAFLCNCSMRVKVENSVFRKNSCARTEKMFGFLHIT